MLRQFNTFIHKNNLYGVHHRLLVTVSGGVDSVVLADLVSRTGCPWGIAHCNFNLRGQESDQDEQFVAQLASKYQVHCFSRTFSTAEYARVQGISVQMAARELRYEWFEEIRQSHGFDFIATAHHRDDVVETILINLIRGTGIKGIQGIRPVNGALIRPLLFASRAEIEAYAKSKKLPFRVDSSNSETKYLRNRIRLEIIPLLHSLNPSFDESVIELAAQAGRLAERWQYEVGKVLPQIMTKQKDQAVVSIGKLLEHPDPQDLLWEIVSPYGFNSSTLTDIYASLDAETGKTFFSKTHRILKDRENLIIAPLAYAGESKWTSGSSIISSGLTATGTSAKAFAAYSGDDKKHLSTETGIPGLPVPLNFRVINRTKSFLIPTNPGIGCFDHEKLRFPLTVRKWKKGDHFFPLGMHKPKKLSDFFVDHKISRIDKENTWLLLSGQDIIWIIGHRIDHRYRITSRTRQVLMITVKA
jgi:tRNA(Ile)-lysidine synthase